MGAGAENSVLRELVQDDEGRLGTRFVPELIPACGKTLPLRFEAPDGTSTTADSVRIELTGETKIVTIPEMDGDYRMQLEVVPEPIVRTLGIALHAGSLEEKDGCETRFPARTAARPILQDEQQWWRCWQRACDRGGRGTRQAVSRSTSWFATISLMQRLLSFDR